MTAPKAITLTRLPSSRALLGPANVNFSYGLHSTIGALPRVTVLHHGKIDNQLALLNQLKDRGYHFTDGSDGELIAHLVDAVHTGDAIQSLRRAAALLQGALAFAVQFGDTPEGLIATVSGRPLALHYDGSLIQWCNPNESTHANPPHEGHGTLMTLHEGEILELHRVHGKASAHPDRASLHKPRLHWRRLPLH